MICFVLGSEKRSLRKKVMWKKKGFFLKIQNLPRLCSCEQYVMKNLSVTEKVGQGLPKVKLEIQKMKKLAFMEIYE